MAAFPPSPDLSPHQNPSFISLSLHDSFSLANPAGDAHVANLAVSTALKPSAFSSPPASGGFAVGLQDYGLGPADMAMPSAKRPRHTSHSPSDHELTTDVKPPRKDSDAVVSSASAEVTTPTDARPNPKKRPSISADTIDYPRRRATIAVCIPHPTDRLFPCPTARSTSHKTTAGR